MGIIYLITNLVDGKYYVGQTSQMLRRRLNFHFCKASTGCPILHRAIKKYGKKNFVVEILAETPDADELDRLEVLWIAISNSTSRKVGYNLLPGGIRGPRGKRTEEFCKKVSVGQAKRWREHKERVDAGKDEPYPTPWNKGRKCTPEEVARMVGTRTGCRQSAESNAKRSASLKGRMPAVNVRNGNKGRKHTEEWKAQCSARIHANPEVLNRLRTAQCGATQTFESNKKRSATMKAKFLARKTGEPHAQL